MANDEHITLLAQGVAAWNAWRDENRHIRPDLRWAPLRWADLSGADQEQNWGPCRWYRKAAGHSVVH